MIELSEAQWQALRKGEAVRLTPPETNEEVVILGAGAYDRLRELTEDVHEKASWARLGRKAAGQWATENPF